MSIMADTLQQQWNLMWQMKVRRIWYQGVQSFLSLKGIYHDTCDNDEANYTEATDTNKENHDSHCKEIMTAASGKDEPSGDIPKMSYSTIPATISLPETFPTTMATGC
jgi:hypothetical protein